MADTIITNTPDRASADGTAGGIIALVIVVALLLGGMLLYRNGAFDRSAAPADGADTNINVTIPDPVATPSGAAPAPSQP